MPKPTVVPVDQVPDNSGRRDKSSAQKVVDAYVGEMLDKLTEIAAGPTSESVLFAFDETDDPGFRFTGASVAHLKDRCRRLLRSAMKDQLPRDVDKHLSTTYAVNLSKLPSSEFEVAGFSAWVQHKR